VKYQPKGPAAFIFGRKGAGAQGDTKCVYAQADGYR